MSTSVSPPYYAVIFTSNLSEDTDGYGQVAEHMLRLATQQPGYLGVESAREGLGITVSYWRSLPDIEAWRRQVDHLAAQREGRRRFYQSYTLRICEVLEARVFERGEPG